MLSESGQAVLSTRRFLEDVSSAGSSDIPESVRRRAEELLGRYPNGNEADSASAPDPSFAEAVESGSMDSSQQRPDSGLAADGRSSSPGYSSAPPYPTEAQDLEMVVTACWSEPALVWARDDFGRRYALDADTRGIVLSDLRVGQGLSCKLSVRGAKMPTVVAARVVPRRYPKDEG